MNVRGLLKARSPLVRQLAHKIEQLRETNRKLREAVESRSVPVLIVVESLGGFNVYGSARADVEIVNMPRGKWDGEKRTLFEEFIELSLPQSHKNVFIPSKWRAYGDHRQCKSLHQIAADEEKKAMNEALWQAIKEIESEKRRAKNTTQTKQ